MPTETESRLSELQGSMKTKLDENELIATKFKDEGKGQLVVTPEQRDRFRKNLKDMDEIKGLIDDLTGQSKMSEWASAPAGKSVALATQAAEFANNMGGGNQGAALWTPQGAAKSLGERFTDSAEFKSLVSEGGYTMRKDFEVNERGMGQSIGRKDLYTYYPTGPAIQPHFGQTQFDPLVVQAMRRTRVRDLFPVQATSANLIDFFRVSGFANAASVVPERSGSVFGLKPQSTLTIVAAQAPVRVIAHFEVAHRNVIMDEPQLQGLINNELLYGLRLQEDYQILQGTGTGEDLLGILNTPGIQGYTGVRAGGGQQDNKADDIRRAATKTILAYYEPTGVIEHPYDWEGTELLKDTQGRYIVTGAVAIGAEKTLWQMPVVDTPAMPQGTALVGAFGLGAQLYDREQGNIRISESHADLFIRNAVVVLAEQRLALACKRPESFCRVALGS